MFTVYDAKSTQTKNILAAPPAIAVLGRLIGSLYLNYTDMSDIMFSGDKLRIADCLELIGTHTDDLFKWLPSEVKSRQIREKYQKGGLTLTRPIVPSEYRYKQTGNGLETAIDWEGMVSDLVVDLIRNGVKADDADLLKTLEQLANACEKESQFEPLALLIKPMASPLQSKDYQNQIRKFERLIRNRVWDERKESNGDRRSLDDEDPKKISALITLECHHYNAEPDTMTKAVILQRACAKYRVKREDFIAKAMEIAGNVSKPQAKAYKLGDFLALESGGGQFLFPGLVPLTGLGLVAGEAGAGKTTLALDMAGALIFGEEFLGVTPTKTGPVLLISSDEQHGDTQPKLINRGLANAPEDQLIPVLGWDVSQMGFLDELMDTHRPPFVIIDSLRKIHLDPNFDENSSNAVHTLTQLENLAAKYCSFICLIHHTNKSKDNKGVNKLRGSTAIAASCSAVYLLEGDQSTKTKKFSTPKIRNCEPVNLVLEMDGYNGKFNVVGDGLIDGLTKSNGDRLTEYFQTRPDTWLSGTELKDLFPDMGRSIYRALTSLVQRGTLRERPAKIGRGKVWCINQSGLVNTGNPLPPMPDSDVVDLTNQTIDIQEIDASQRLVNAKSTLSQHPENIDNPLTNETIDIQEIDASQRQTTPEGRGGYVDSVDLGPVPPITTVETTAIETIDNCPQTTDTAIAMEPTELKPGFTVIGKKSGATALVKAVTPDGVIINLDADPSIDKLVTPESLTILSRNGL